MFSALTTAKRPYALYRDSEDRLFATDGVCTHGNTHLSEGLMVGNMIECAKHNGRFNLIDGSPARAPICRGLATYPVEERERANSRECRPRRGSWSPRAKGLPVSRNGQP